MMTAPRTTIIVTQRERFGMTQESLEDLYAHTDTPFRLIYVDGNSPKKTATYLREQAAARGFRLIRRERYLTPNQARNVGLKEADTEFVVFADNDVLYTKGWLAALERCADETGAAVVAPLTCHAIPAHTTIHHAGGDYTPDPDRMDDFFAAVPPGGRPFVEIMHGHNEKVAESRDRLVRKETGFCEFHLVLARRDVFDRIGPLDEKMLSTKEHLDFSMSVRAAGGTVWFEPASVVTYVFPSRARPLEPADWPFFALRWSDDYGRRSLEHFIAKWQVKTPEGYVREKRGIYASRREQAILIPLARKLPVLGGSQVWPRRVASVVAPFERQVNRVLVAYFDRASRRAA